jgi:hypothetical protein
LHRYLSEYDFRYNNRIALGVNDEVRAELALKGIVGKRLTYQTTSESRDRMDKKPKAGGFKKKAVPKKKAPDEKQFERFVKTARELEVDETGNKFEKAMRQLLPMKTTRQQ